jgi:hypothetical protein
MVNLFGLRKVPPQHCLFDEAMFQDVPILIGAGMVRLVDPNVSLVGNSPAALPRRAVDASKRLSQVWHEGCTAC